MEKGNYEALFLRIAQNPLSFQRKSRISIYTKTPPSPTSTVGKQLPPFSGQA